MAPLTLFYAFRDAPERRAALRAPVGSLDRYRLFGLDELAQRADGTHHNLEDGAAHGWARAASRAINAPLYRAGGYGGDFATMLASLRRVNRADVVLSTVDTVGIPLMLLKRAGLVRPPLVYVSIGLPERLAQLRGRRMQQLYAGALRGTEAIVAYAKSEADQLRRFLAGDGPTVSFVPFGVDVDAFRPAPEVTADLDVLSVGADPRRDFELLLGIAARRPERGFRIVASPEHARTLRAVPENVTVESDLSLDEVRNRLARARVVALPVRENSYSGGTTVLLQAMAMAKPVVVSKTAAVSDGYELEDGVNCRLVPPGDTAAFERALDEETGADAVSSIGIRARETVERGFSWERYTNALWEIVRSARRPPSG
jgi:glycosyltransferase involved in cell wall biosynthesis